MSMEIPQKKIKNKYKNKLLVGITVNKLKIVWDKIKKYILII